MHWIYYALDLDEDEDENEMSRVRIVSLGDYSFADNSYILYI